VVQGVLAIASTTPFEDAGTAGGNATRGGWRKVGLTLRLTASALLAPAGARPPRWMAGQPACAVAAPCTGLAPLPLPVVASRLGVRCGERLARAVRRQWPFRAATALRLLAGVVVIGALVGVASGGPARRPDGAPHHELPRGRAGRGATGVSRARAELWFSPPDLLPSLRPRPRAPDRARPTPRAPARRTSS
jgi:hypothetical protein